MKQRPYNPLTEEEAQAKANKIAQKVCPSCHNDYETGCQECPWYLLMNAMIDEADFWMTEDEEYDNALFYMAYLENNWVMNPTWEKK